MASIKPLNYYSFSHAYDRVNRKLSRFALNLIGSNEDLPTISNPKTIKCIEWIGKNLSSAENRLILGASALLSQPFIDASNKNVDDETRRYSVCRSIAKIVVGTATGYTIRKLSIKAIAACSKLSSEIKPDMRFKKLRQFLTPTLKSTAEELSQYKNTLGTIMGLGIMVFTNFLIDAPLTKALTNFLAGRSDNK